MYGLDGPMVNSEPRVLSLFLVRFPPLVADTHRMRRLRLAFALCLVLAAVLAAAPQMAAAGGGVSLSVTKKGPGGGRVTSVPAGIDCGSTCVYDFGPGAGVTLSAEPNAGSTFVGWKGACSGAGGCDVTMSQARSVRAVFVPSWRPDAWIKLCGLSTGCTINPLPHPWKGNGVYNASGWKQRIAVRLNNGEGVRFWLALQNDGALGDTIRVQGCKGTPRFLINAVLIGKHKRPNWKAVNITSEFKKGTAEFDFPPSSAGKKVYITLNFVTPTPAVGVSYSCRVTISSVDRPGRSDTVVARMSTY